MGTFENEADLRRWLREGWQEGRWGPLIWVEAARGGTDGAPDVFIPTNRFGYLPTELKAFGRGKTKSERERIEIRPAQKRLHKLIKETNRKSIMLAVDCERQRIGVAFGYAVAESANGIPRVQRFVQNIVERPADLVHLLNGNGFWQWWG